MFIPYDSGQTEGARKGLIDAMLQELFQITIASMFPNKEKGDKLRVVVTGQSNASGIEPATAGSMIKNLGVRDYNAPSTDMTNFSLNIADPDRVSGLTGFTPWTGMVGEGNGNIGFSFCDTLNKSTGIFVDMLQVTMLGANSTFWAEGGDVAEEIEARLPGFLEESGGDKIDCVLYQQGESDRLEGSNPPTFANAVLTARTEAERAGWSTPGYTKWLVVDIPERLGLWDGVIKAVDLLKINACYVSTAGRQSTTEYHYLGNEANAIGKDACGVFLNSPSAARYPENGRKNDLYYWNYSSVGTAPFTLGGSKGSSIFNIFCMNKFKTKYYSAVIHVWYLNGSNKGFNILNEAGEAGFTYTVQDFFNVVGFLTVTPTVGQTWQWSVSQNDCPQVLTPEPTP